MRLTLADIATLIGGVLPEEEGSREIHGVAALDEATAGEISFFGNEKYARQFASTGASAVIVPRGTCTGPANVALVQVDNPSYAFGEVVKHFTRALEHRFHPGVHERAIIADGVTYDPKSVRIHPGAVIMADAEIGDGSEIGPNAVIGEAVKIGRDCLIHAHVSIRERCELGDRVTIQPGAVVGSDGFGYETVDGHHVKIDQIGIVVIGDDVEIGANTTIDRARFGRTIIGAGTKIDNLVQIGHNVCLGEHNLVVSQTGLAGSCRTGKYVVMAAQNGVAGHLTIGDHAVLTGRCGVTTDLEGGQTYGGSPAQLHSKNQREKAALRKLPDLLKRVSRLEQSP